MPEVLKNLLYVIYIIVCLALIVVTLLQPSEGQHSAEEIYDENTKANKFFDKNKSRTKTGRMYKKTIVLGIVFAVLTVIVGIVCLF